jgi:hypothetical protein
MKAEASPFSQTTQIADYARRGLSELLVIEGANAPASCHALPLDSVQVPALQ